MTFFDLTLTTRASLHPDGEPDDFIADYTGFIHAEGEDGIARKVGKIHAWRINAELAAAHGESLFDVCDAHSRELHVIHQLLYQRACHAFKKPIAALFGAASGDCLVLDYIVLRPRWRGLKLGLLAARKMVDLLGGGCGLVVCDIAPVRADAYDMVRLPRSWIPRQETFQEQRQAVVKLRRYYRRMGFKRIGRSPYYALSLTRRQPTLADLLRPASETQD